MRGDTLPLRVLIAGGGTGGHVVPALAIGRELRDRHQGQITYVGTARGLETRLIPEAGFPLELIQVGQLKNVSIATRLKTFTDLPRSILHCLALLRRLKPQVVIGVGGYASGPAMLAAVLLRIPTLAFEPNAVPGLANRLVGRFVSAAAINFPETAAFFRNARLTGIPVRPEFLKIPDREASAAKRLLILGGSLGSQALNEAMPGVAADLLAAFPELTIVHQAGQRHAENTQRAYNAANIDSQRVTVVPFLDAIAAVAEADLLVCRSGASTVAELCAAGRPAIFVPFPQAADDHQTHNAQAIVRAGAAELLPQKELTSETLRQAVVDLFSNSSRLEEMGRKARSLAHPEALSTIATLASELAS